MLALELNSCVAPQTFDAVNRARRELQATFDKLQARYDELQAHGAQGSREVCDFREAEAARTEAREATQARARLEGELAEAGETRAQQRALAFGGPLPAE